MKKSFKNHPEEFDDLPDFLKQQSDKPAFNAPDSYFENVQKKVLAKMQSEEVHTQKPIGGIKRWLPYAIAASMLGIIAFVAIQYSTRTETVKQDLFAQLDEEALFEYVQEHADVYNDEELASILPVEGESNIELEDLESEDIEILINSL